MFEKVPTFAAAGVPCRRPVLVRERGPGRLVRMLNVSVSPFASAAVGVNVYSVPIVAARRRARYRRRLFSPPP